MLAAKTIENRSRLEARAPKPLLNSGHGSRLLPGLGLALLAAMPVFAAQEEIKSETKSLDAHIVFEDKLPNAVHDKVGSDILHAEQVCADKNKTNTANTLIANSKKLHIYRWQDKTKTPRAVIVAVHGTTQHAGSFGALAQHLTKEGFIFIGLDLRGHGERWYQAFAGQPNFRVDYDKSADDLGNLIRKVKSTYPGLPVFCLGESVGAAVATHCLGRNKGIANGLILCSPGSRPRAFNPFMVVPDFVKGITHLDEQMDVSRYIDHYSSDDKRVSDEMIADPRSRVRLTPKEILRTAFFIRTIPQAAKEMDPNMPVLIVQGAEDGIVSGKSTQAILKNLPNEHKELLEFKDAGHVLLGTSFLKPQVVDSLSKWISNQTEINRTKVIGLHETEATKQSSSQ